MRRNTSSDVLCIGDASIRLSRTKTTEAISRNYPDRAFLKLDKEAFSGTTTGGIATRAAWEPDDRIKILCKPVHGAASSNDAGTPGSPAYELGTELGMEGGESVITATWDSSMDSRS